MAMVVLEVIIPQLTGRQLKTLQLAAFYGVKILFPVEKQ